VKYKKSRGIVSTHYHGIISSYSSSSSNDDDQSSSSSNVQLGYMDCVVVNQENEENNSKEDSDQEKDQNSSSSSMEHQKVIFLYKLTPGSISSSYGINVAKLSNLPSSIISTASQKSSHFQSIVLTNQTKNHPSSIDHSSSEEDYQNEERHESLRDELKYQLLNERNQQNQQEDQEDQFLISLFHKYSS